MDASSPSSRLTPQISVVIVDDHLLFRSLLSDVIGRISDFKLVGQCENAEEAISFCATRQPDIVLLDSHLPKQQGPEAVSSIIEASPRTRVIMLSGTVNTYAWRCALKGGARGFISKATSLHELVQGIRAVQAGDFFISKEAYAILRRVAETISAGDTPVEITARERDVLAGIARGLSSKQIAGQIGLSVFTVENHRRRICARTGLNSIAELTLLALSLGLVPPVIGEFSVAHPKSAG